MGARAVCTQSTLSQGRSKFLCFIQHTHTYKECGVFALGWYSTLCIYSKEYRMASSFFFRFPRRLENIVKKQWRIMLSSFYYIFFVRKFIALLMMFSK